DQLGDRDAAKDALRAVLAMKPDHLDALHQLAKLCLDGKDWSDAADALIRIVRLHKDTETLRWVFFTLGNIYDEQLPDPYRSAGAQIMSVRWRGASKAHYALPSRR